MDGLEVPPPALGPLHDLRGVRAGPESHPDVLERLRFTGVLDFGELIFQGDPQQITNSPVVRAAYLGDADVEAAVEPGHAIEEVIG